MSLEHIYLEYFTTNQAYKTKVGGGGGKDFVVEIIQPMVHFC